MSDTKDKFRSIHAEFANLPKPESFSKGVSVSALLAAQQNSTTEEGKEILRIFNIARTIVQLREMRQQFTSIELLFSEQYKKLQHQLKEEHKAISDKKEKDRERDDIRMANEAEPVVKIQDSQDLTRILDDLDQARKNLEDNRKAYDDASKELEQAIMVMHSKENDVVNAEAEVNRIEATLREHKAAMQQTKESLSQLENLRYSMKQEPIELLKSFLTEEYLNEEYKKLGIESGEYLEELKSEMRKTLALSDAEQMLLTNDDMSLDGYSNKFPNVSEDKVAELKQFMLNRMDPPSDPEQKKIYLERIDKLAYILANKGIFASNLKPDQLDAYLKANADEIKMAPQITAQMEKEQAHLASLETEQKGLIDALNVKKEALSIAVGDVNLKKQTFDNAKKNMDSSMQNVQQKYAAAGMTSPTSQQNLSGEQKEFNDAYNGSQPSEDRTTQTLLIVEEESLQEQKQEQTRTRLR
jgi:hypothetical protein